MILVDVDSRSINQDGRYIMSLLQIHSVPFIELAEFGKKTSLVIDNF